MIVALKPKSLDLSERLETKESVSISINIMPMAGSHAIGYQQGKVARATNI